MRHWRFNPPAKLFAAATVVVGLATLVFADETRLLATKREPYTWYIRNRLSWEPTGTIVLVSVISFLWGAAVAHFVADEKLNAGTPVRYAK